MIGVPGAGKSWIIGKIKTWIDIRLKITDLPYFSSESYTLNLIGATDPVTEKAQESIAKISEGKLEYLQPSLLVELLPVSLKDSLYIMDSPFQSR